MTLPASLGLTIDGARHAGAAGTTPVINPASGEPFADCPLASPAQLDAAVAAASRAFVDWRRSSDATRIALLEGIAERIEQHAEELATLVVQEQGKPLALARIEAGGAIAWTRAAAAERLPVETLEDGPARQIQLHRMPLGVVGSITPWNWPLLIAAWHVMPALRAGNAVVIKPSTLTPLSTLRLLALIGEVAPAGLVNCVTGDADIGRAMAQHPQIAKIVFTGSTATGRDIMRNGADTLKRLTLELGGNDAGIVLPDADVDAIAEPIFQSAFLNMGQTCAALKRLYVHESLHESLCERLVAIAATQVLGNGLDAGVTFGPLQNPAQRQRVAALVDDARARGARVRCGGMVPGGPGYFYPPTIVDAIDDGVALVDAEQFGPALPVIRYRDVDDAIARANRSPFGLGASLWGRDADAASALALRLEAGTVWINGHAEVLPHCPFGGCKQSGFGVEFGRDGLLEYTRPQAVSRLRAAR